MYQIKKNNIITLTRGDYLKFPVALITGIFPKQKRVVLENDDTVLFGLMEPNMPFECAVLKKEYNKDDQDENGNIFITINPEDTIGLEPGTYYYSIKMLYDEDEEAHIDTIVQNTRFNII